MNSSRLEITRDGADDSHSDAARRMLELDAASRGLGIELVDAGPGRAVVRMTVTADMVNGLGVCHGGVVFTLADTAMALVSNGAPSTGAPSTGTPSSSAPSDGTPSRTIASGARSLATGAAIDFLAPGAIGDVLTATCTEVVRPGRNAVNDASVVNQRGEPIALFRGRTLTVGGS